MELALADKVIFIAGASRGIGYAMAEGFLREGATVAITGRDEQALDAAFKRLSSAHLSKVIQFAGDMTDSATIERAMNFVESSSGPIHCAIANVGGGLGSAGFDISDEQWDAELAQNLTGSLFVARSALRRMTARGELERLGSNVILVSSISGINIVSANIPYATSKAAIIHASAYMARAAGSKGVRVNTIVPGNIFFPGGVWDKRLQERPEAFTRWIKREVPLGRFGEPGEIADAAVWLASERASYVNGTTIVVDGGQVR